MLGYTPDTMKLVERKVELKKIKLLTASTAVAPMASIVCFGLTVRSSAQAVPAHCRTWVPMLMLTVYEFRMSTWPMTFATVLQLFSVPQDGSLVVDTVAPATAVVLSTYIWMAAPLLEDVIWWLVPTVCSSHTVGWNHDSTGLHVDFSVEKHVFLNVIAVPIAVDGRLAATVVASYFCQYEAHGDVPKRNASTREATALWMTM